MKAERTTSSYVLTMGVLGLLVVGSFVAYQVYAAVVKSQITTEQKKAIKPLDGKIEEEAVSNLKKRRQFGATELNQKLSFDVVVVEEEIETINETVATVSGETLESSQEASETGKVEEGNEN